MFLLSLRCRTFPAFQRRGLATATRDPLRILFCGSDHFSCASLKALHEEHVKNGQLIESLDVVVLPPKWAGRGNKELREVPCKLLAEGLGLRIHQRSTFREWEPPEGTNLIVAVSFGLFVPSRILRGAKYGGLNVHPSLLPDLRGPAPVHHALLNGDKYTGVSLQTLDDKAFDHGTVLAQAPKDSFAIPENASLHDLTSQLGDIGAKMLVQGLRDGVHIPPHKDVSSHNPELKLRHAPKVSKAESSIDWGAGQSLPSEVLERKLKGIMQVFGSAWTEATTESGKTKRLVFRDVEAVRRPMEQNQRLFIRLANGQERAVVVEKSTQRCLIHWRDDLWVSVGEVTGHGSIGKPAAQILRGHMFKKTET